MATQSVPVVSSAEMTFEEFLTAYDGVHAEWVDGQVYVMSPGNKPQSRLTRFLASIIQDWVEAHDLGEVFVAPYTVRVRERAAREPDVFFLRSEHLDRLHGTFVDGPPDLVIEISSPGSRGLDRGEKFFEYAEAGVAEYWVIDPERKKVEAYRRGRDGTYDPVPLGEPPVLRSEALPGMEIAVEWLWEQPLPKQAWVRERWGLA